MADIKVILIDKSPESVTLFEEAFKNSSIHIDCVQELGIAFQRLKQHDYDFVLLDPDFVLVNAKDVIPIVIGFAKDTPVVIVTDSIFKEEEQCFIQLGGKAVFYKEQSQWLKLREYLEIYIRSQ